MHNWHARLKLQTTSVHTNLLCQECQELEESGSPWPCAQSQDCMPAKSDAHNKVAATYLAPWCPCSIFLAWLLLPRAHAHSARGSGGICPPA